MADLRIVDINLLPVAEPVGVEAGTVYRKYFQFLTVNSSGATAYLDLRNSTLSLVVSTGPGGTAVVCPNSGCVIVDGVNGKMGARMAPEDTESWVPGVPLFYTIYCVFPGSHPLYPDDRRPMVEGSITVTAPAVAPEER
jgi:hypothetical protein